MTALQEIVASLPAMTQVNGKTSSASAAAASSDPTNEASNAWQRLIDEKRAGTLAGIELIRELENLTEAVRAAVEESNQPIGQQLALKVKARNAAISR